MMEYKQSLKVDTYKFCPLCGSKSDRTSTNLLVCPKCGYNFYINPAVTNAVIIENPKGEILLITRRDEPKKGYLDLPGGFAESGESLEESAIREIKEELGLDLKEVTYFGSYPDEYLFLGVNLKTLSFILTAKSDQLVFPKISDEISNPEFYQKDDIPIEKIAFEGLQRGLRDYLKKK